jgi:hypothetical protein
MDDASEAASDAPPPSEVSGSLFGGSAPPQPNPQVQDAATVQAHHPFFAAAQRGIASRGKGGKGAARGRGAPVGRGRGRGSAADAVSEAEEARGPQFTGISAREVEYMQRQQWDGAASTVASDEEDAGGPTQRPRKRRALPAPSVDGDGERPERPPPDECAAAAFGAEADEDDDGPICEEADGRSDSQFGSNADGPQMLPIRGESCAGCTLDRSIVERVDAFVRQHATSMSDTALYRAAALFYHNEIVKPRAREGVTVPGWSWKTIRSHYTLHSADPVLERIQNIHSLGLARMVAQGALMRVNEDGSKCLDHQNMKMLLSIIGEQSKQLTELDKSRMPPPAPRSGR